MSQSRPDRDEPERLVRIARKVLDGTESQAFVQEQGRLLIRVTDGGRQEIVARFYVDDRQIKTLGIQRFTCETGKPLKTHFTFQDDEIPALLDFLENIRLVHFPDDNRINVTDEELKQMLLTPTQIRALMLSNEAELVALAESEITTRDLVALGYRKTQLERFRRLLEEPDHFEAERVGTAGDEAVWQRFFEENPWVFGYGLAFVYLSQLADSKLEQVVAGYSFSSVGKRADALLKTRGAIESLRFVEIKKPDTDLLRAAVRPYRSGCWAPSEELVGAVAQVQGTVEQAVRGLETKTETTDSVGNPTGEALFSYQPKSFLIVGSLEQFISNEQPNIEKFRSFELFRRNTQTPEIITFDELYQRAKFIVSRADG